MKPKCPQCNKELNFVGFNNPWSDNHYLCDWCDGTYNIFEFCVFCGLRTETRNHHLVPKSQGGKIIVYTCLTCESFIHNTWSHNELSRFYYESEVNGDVEASIENTIKAFLKTEKFQKFLKWRLKQPVECDFKSSRGQFRDKRKYS